MSAVINSETIVATLAVLLLGNTSTPDLATVGQTVRLLAGPDCLRTAVSVADLELQLTDGWAPDVVVVAQNAPDEFSSSEIQRLLGRFPLAKWYCFYGPWCDSDGRNRDLWPLAFRIPASSTSATLRRELANLASRKPLPWTASRSEIFEEFASETLPGGLHSLRVSVSSPDRAWYDLWLCALRQAGCHILSADELARAQVLLWDADPWDEVRAGQLASLHRKMPHTKLLAALGYYRADIADELKDHGATAVVSKLSSICEILKALAGMQQQ